MDEITYGALRPNDVDSFVRVVEAALHFHSGDLQKWMRITGPQGYRVVRQHNEVLAGLGIIEMGQWFGGARVPIAGITAVGVAPEHRGTGIGTRLMCTMLQEIHEKGIPLSVLYPATLPFYRRVGYERAGVQLTYELPLQTIDVRDTTLEIHPAEDEAAIGSIYELYDQRAYYLAGHLDRPQWMWDMKFKSGNQTVYKYLIVRDSTPEGYVVVTQSGRDQPLRVLDMGVTTQNAGKRLLTFFSGYRSMVESVMWRGGPRDPLLYLLADNLIGGMRPKHTIQRTFDWMVRIVDVVGALSARGYPDEVQAELHLEIRDNLLPNNNGRFVMEVNDGYARVSPGGQGHIYMHIRDLAALYTGYVNPFELRTAGSLTGSDSNLALLGLLFAGPQPWMPDMF
ncbi:MAG: GNAT family N-acetyltransferase [Chloroflexota bacterium]